MTLVLSYNVQFVRDQRGQDVLLLTLQQVKGLHCHLLELWINNLYVNLRYIDVKIVILYTCGMHVWFIVACVYSFLCQPTLLAVGLGDE